MENLKDIYVLCVDDEKDILEDLSLLFSEMGFQTLTATNPDEAIPLIQKYAKDLALIVSDYQMPGVNGLDFRKSILKDHQIIPFAILSGFVSKEMALTGLEYKICAFLDKPFTKETLQKLVEKECETRVASIKEDRELLEGFCQDASSLLEELEPLIMTLESTPGSQEVINNMYRILHTIKGTSGFFDNTIAKFAHKFEDCLTQAKNGTLVITPPVVSVFLKAYDRLSYLVSTVKSQETRTETLEELLQLFAFEAASSLGQANQKAQDSGAPVVAQKAKDWVKVTIANLDDFMEHSGQITVIRNMVNKLVRSIEKEYSGNRDVALLGELLEEMHNINSSMQDKMVELRKQPLKETFRSYPRLIRDLSNSLQKEIDMQIEGEDLKVDTAIGEVLNNSLVHMLRNCCDHGIETPEEREKTGKPRQGLIQLKCYEQGEEVLVELIDNGKGLDQDRIKAKLKEKGMFTESELSQMSKQKIFSMIFEPGFSTAQKVTDVSGRGVGMDMVRTSVEKIRGSIDIQSEVGKGTKFTLKLPIPKSVLIINSLMVDCSGQTFAIPQDDIQRLVSVESDKRDELIAEMEGADILRLGNELVPLIWLNEALCLAKQEKDKNATLNIVVAKTKQGQFGIVVDSISNVEDAVVKPLGRHLATLNVYSGGTFLGDGKIGLILHPENLAIQNGIDKFHQKKDETTLAASSTNDSSREYLLFELATKGMYAIPLDDVFRLEEFPPQSFQFSGNQRVIVYRDQVMPALSLRESLGLPRDMTDVHDAGKRIPFVVLKHRDKYFALMLKRIVDIAVANEPLDVSVVERTGLAGTVFLKGHTATVVDVKAVMLKAGIGKEIFAEIMDAAPAAV